MIFEVFPLWAGFRSCSSRRPSASLMLFSALQFSQGVVLVAEDDEGRRLPPSRYAIDDRAATYAVSGYDEMVLQNEKETEWRWPLLAKIFSWLSSLTRTQSYGGELAGWMSVYHSQHLHGSRRPMVATSMATTTLTGWWLVVSCLLCVVYRYSLNGLRRKME
ncbi:hypothetical protein CDEST_01906 [Colletotrichum destructivum]|uniref:Uncharacterized protein n=1 Tax=Colletotrichum destructivum TaxID=34406 RepID=A0AAX4I194_9PEZI|nr:hypothetical protein CDEST_01906 [Colletotrichum destructivum]